METFKLCNEILEVHVRQQKHGDTFARQDALLEESTLDKSMS
jgi:hypothetical protein